MQSAIHSTLQHVTDRKLSKLAVQFQKFSENKSTIQAYVNAHTSTAQQVKTLIEECKHHGIKTGRSGMSVGNIQRFLEQAEYDPSVSTSLLNEWKKMLQRDVEIQGRKYEYASLFGRLVTEWIESPNDDITELSVTCKNGSAGEEANSDWASDSNWNSNSDSDSFQPIGRQEMHNQRQEWESYAFHEKKCDREAIDKYLKDLFNFSEHSNRLKPTPLQELRSTMADFDKMKPTCFDADVVSWCIAGVIQSDIFAGKKRAALVDLKSRTAVLKEMADVLNMDLESIDTWQWENAPVPLIMRRQVNGKYRVFYDEDIHQSILFHFIGAKLAVHMKQAFTAFFRSGAWNNTPFQTMDRYAQGRRMYFLGSSPPHDIQTGGIRGRNGMTANTIRGRRTLMYENDFFMTQLPGSLESDIWDYGDSNGSESMDDTRKKTALEIKESMHRLATTEMLINTTLYGEFTMIQSDFRWFGPSLPFDTIFAIMKFLGVRQKWLTFFRKFLETPTIWSQDGPSGVATTRKRGIPMSHVLGDALAEAVLFCLDFSVNKHSGGANLYRFHDDLWFWGQEDVCIKAWKAVLEFTQIMGLELNEEKTGSVQIFDETTRSPSNELPNGEITWGLLRLDSTTARWIIDERKIREHVVELHRQLSACRSVLSWIQAWNSYVCRFFATNMGKPAACFGLDHVDMVIKAFVDIQGSLFQGLMGMDAGISVNGYLRHLIKERFGVANVPDGFLYFPSQLGGLEVRNPLIPLFAIRSSALQKPDYTIQHAFDDECDNFELLKKRFEAGEVKSLHSKPGCYIPEDPDEPFMDIEEYSLLPEETSDRWLAAYDTLLQASEPFPINESREFEAAARDWESCNLYRRDTYWQWVFDLYTKDMIGLFGGLEIGEKGMLPLGLVEMLKSERPRWLG